MNTFADYLGLLNTELRFEPFYWISILLGIIATALAMTQRNDIAGDRTWAIIAGEGDPVVSGEGMPKAGRTPTRSAAAFEMIEGKLPVCIRKSIGQRSNSGRSALTNHQTLGRVFTLPTQRTIQDNSAFSFVVCATSNLSGWGMAKGIGAAILLGSFALLIHLDFAFYRFAIPEIVLVCILGIALWVGRAPTLLLLPVTGFALRAEAGFVATVAREVFRGRGILLLADRTAFHGCFPYWPYSVKCGKAVRLAVRSVHGAVLSHSCIVPQIQEFC